MRSTVIANPADELHALGALIEAERYDTQERGRLRGEILRSLTAEVLTVPAHVELLGVLRSLARSQVPIDLASVTPRLKTKEAKRALLDAAESVITGARSGPDAARRVAVLAERRALQAAALEVARRAGEDLDDPDFAGQLRMKVARTGARGDDRTVDGLEWMSETWREVERLHEKGEAPGVQVGFAPFDLVGGLERGLPTYVGGRPGAGKTGFGITVLINAALAGFEALALSLEMTRIDLGFRVLSGVSGVPLHLVRDPRRMDADCYAQLGRGLHRVDGAMQRIRVNAPSRMTIEAVQDYIVCEHAVRPLDLVMVDYLTLVRSTDTRTREREVAAVSEGLRELAKETGIAFLVLAQLNREIERRSNPIPTLADFRDSGSIEQDGGTVVAVSQWERTEAGEVRVMDDERDMHFLKRRNGQAGVVHRVRFDGARGAWFSETETPHTWR